MERVKILSIDDDKEILFSLNAIFSFKKWESINAQNVLEAIELFKEHNPDIVLIDYHLPHINGIDGVRLLRALDPTVPIIVFTIEESQEVAENFLLAGASDFALKPIKAPDIISRIGVHLKLRDTVKNAKDSIDNKLIAKGISSVTLALIEEYMKTQKAFLTIDEIAEGTGLAYQTTHRYIQHLLNANIIEATNEYGKIGRPKQKYKI